MSIILKNESETIQFAHQFAGRMQPPVILALTGDLGSGKTFFTRALARSCGISSIITSPTFVILKEYNLLDKGKLIHIDCYRLSSPEELLDLGWEEFISDPDNIVVVEWADRVKDIIPASAEWLHFRVGDREGERVVEKHS